MAVVRSITYAERAAFYETEYATTADHDFLKALVAPDVHAILEVPSGVGRNLDWLAASGRAVVMADLEPAMIARLQERIVDRGAQDQVTALVADMRTLRLPWLFDLLIVPQGGLQLLSGPEDALRALRTLRCHLRTTGRVVLDLATFDVDADCDEDARPSYFDPTVPNGQLIHEWTRPLNDGERLTRSRIQHLGPHTLSTTFFYRLQAPGRPVQGSSFVMRSYRYQYAQVIVLIRASGLRVQGICKNYKGDPYDGSGHRMIFVLTVA